MQLKNKGGGEALCFWGGQLYHYYVLFFLNYTLFLGSFRLFCVIKNFYKKYPY
jgi:hypothetical protein